MRIWRVISSGFSRVVQFAQIRCRPERLIHERFWTADFPDFAESRVSDPCPRNDGNRAQNRNAPIPCRFRGTWFWFVRRHAYDEIKAWASSCQQHCTHCMHGHGSNARWEPVAVGRIGSDACIASMIWFCSRIADMTRISVRKPRYFTMPGQWRFGLALSQWMCYDCFHNRKTITNRQSGIACLNAFGRIILMQASPVRGNPVVSITGVSKH